MAQLRLELVPRSCWWSNVRSQVTKSQWDKCKRFVRERSGGRCEICHAKPKNYVECHEIWDYDDDRQIQTLVGLIALCSTCHKAKHLGRTEMTGTDGEIHRVLEHIRKVNKWSWAQLIQARDTAFAIWSIRSDWAWGLDVSYLAEVGVDLPKYTWTIEERAQA